MNQIEGTFDTGAVRRRSPFGENPDVGSRGTRTQQRILRAALAVFDEVGYHDCGVDRIAARAECSRPSFYQYFSSKEDLFRVLAGDLARRLFEISGGPDPITPDAQGWEVLRSFVEEYSEVYELYAPVFAAFSTAVTVDDAVATGSERASGRLAADLISRVDRRAFRQRQGEVVASVLLNGVSRVQRFRQVLAEADGVPIDSARMDDSLADVMHRTFFGQRRGINVRKQIAAHRGPPPATGSAVALPAAPATSIGQAGRRTRNRLLDAGREVFAANGYHDTRVDDIVALAETSHGTFYRYFENKQALFRIIAARSGSRVVAAVDDLPDVASRAGTDSARELRQWLRRYFAVYATEGPVIRAWIEAMWADEQLLKASPGQVEVLRARLAQFLAPRGFGDIDADAVTLMALLDRSQPMLGPMVVGESAIVDAFTLVLQRGLLPER